jgi:SNF2 family DNA or RNA helicase
MMSGTPILNNPLEFWPALHRIAPTRFPSFWAFEKNMAIMSTGRFRKVVGYRPEAMLELRQFLAQHSIRRRKDQVGIEMPKVVYSTIDVDLTSEQRRLYNRIRDEFKLALANGEIKSVTTALAQITRLMQACFSPELYGGSPASAKIEELRDIVKELVGSGEKAIIFSQWKDATRILQREFAEYNPAYVDGTVKPKQRVLEEDKFNTDPTCMLYIGTIGANQEAITLGAGTYVIFTDKAWTPLANDQAAARSAAGGLRGVGVEVPVNIIELHAVDTFEERIEDLLARKKALFNATVEKDAGAAVERITLADIRSLL